MAISAYPSVRRKKSKSRVAEILVERFHNEIFYPNLNVQLLSNHIRVIRPISVDKTLMAQRIARLRHHRIHSQAPHSRTRHLVLNIHIVQEGSHDHRIRARANFIMVEYRPSVPEGIQRVFAGVYEYDLRPVPESFKVRSKKATLINCDSTLSPLALYF